MSTPQALMPTDAVMQTPLHERSAWRPWSFELEAVDLVFELDARRTVVQARLRLARRPGVPASEPLVLEGRGPELLDLQLDGQPVAPQDLVLTDRSLTIHRVPERFDLQVRAAVQPQSNLSGRGLFVLDGTLVTQMEPEGMHRLIWFPDRPDVLARYRVTLIADPARYPVLLSNGNRVSERLLDDGRLEVVWDDPFRKPSYVFGLVAGNLACLRDTCRMGSGRSVRLAVYAPQAHIDRCRFALEALARAMQWDEAVFGLPCDVDDFQIVALNGFPGAMENKGLNLFDLAGVVADPEVTTDDEALTIERIIAHEYFHNWTGNRVTCRDWFQLSLKEGLTRFRDQCYIDDRLGGVYRLDMVRQMLRNQFPEDDGPNRHPIRPERYADVEELYTPTVYDKGAEVIRMMQTLVGPQRFIQGVQAYLHTFDGQAVTTDDFVDTVQAVGAVDLQRFRRWYGTAGRPRVSVQRLAIPDGIRLVLEQRMPHAPATATAAVAAALPSAADDAALTVPIRLSWLSPQGQVLQARRSDGGDPGLIVLDTSGATVDFIGIGPDAIPSLLEGFSAPVSLDLPLTGAERRVLLARGRDPWSRWNAAQSLMIEAIRAQAQAVHAGREPAFGHELVEALEQALRSRGSSPAETLLVAELLRVPDEPVLSEGLPVIDVDGHHTARVALRAHLGRALRPWLMDALTSTGHDDQALMHVAGMARRRLAAVSLDLLAATGDEEVAQCCHDRALNAPTMTERFDALACLVDLDHPLRQTALDAFIGRWASQPTVVNKWFMAQALSRAPDALDRIMALQAHPLFKPTDIAQGLAYFGSFFRQNRVVFHHPSGRAYEWLADMLIMLDRLKRPGAVWITPQISAWRRHGPARQALMHKALRRVLDHTDPEGGTHALVKRLLAS